MITLYLVIAGFILAFFLAFGVGANDVANSFGTSVGSKVLTLKMACILATIFETMGAVLMGQKVSDSVRNNLMNYGDMYKNNTELVMLSCISSLIGSTGWTIFATAFKLPISGTHSIIGSMMGVAVATTGNFDGVSGKQLGLIVASWFLSPVLAGAVSSAVYKIIAFFVIDHVNMVQRGLVSMSLFYSFTVFINVFSIVHNGSALLRFNLLEWYWVLIISLALAALVGLGIWFLYVPKVRLEIAQFSEKLFPEINEKLFPETNGTLGNKPIEVAYIADPSKPQVIMGAPASPTLLLPQNGLDNHTDTKETDEFGNLNSSCSLKVPSDEPLEGLKDKPDPPAIAKIFTNLQILTAIFGAFAHGGNDVSNAIGPAVTSWLAFKETDLKGETPMWILALGGMGISVGLWVWGQRVIRTLGEGLTRITPSSGFSIELGSAGTVLLASKLGLPISTTHCKVGAIVFVGLLSQKERGVDFKLFKNIALAWLCTVPTAAILSGFCQYVLVKAFRF